jgi:urea transporter
MAADSGELLARFFIGGVIVSFFAVIAEMLQPKTFAGLFGAAPSVALATLGITIAHHGKSYAATEARSMVFGAIAFCCYALAVSWMLRRYRPSALAATTTLLPIWFVVSFALCWVANKP